MFGRDSSDAAWSRFGSSDPYYGVCTVDRFQASRLTPDAKADFFYSGEHHIAQILGVIRESLVPNYRPLRALDFGCGVGRITIPLARVCPDVVAVDVSEGMLAEARKNCLEHNLPHVQFALSDDSLSRVRGPFDLVHSFIVFQHIPPPRGLRILAALLDLLAAGGVGVLHFTYARRASRVRKVGHWLRQRIPLLHGLVNVLQGGSFGEAMMQMNSYNLNRVCAILQEKGCVQSCMRFTDHGGHLGVVLFVQKQAASVEG